MNKYKMGHLEGNLRPSYIWDARFLKVNIINDLEMNNLGYYVTNFVFSLLSLGIIKMIEPKGLDLLGRWLG